MSSFKDHIPDPVKVNKGVRLPITDPKTGSVTADYLLVKWRHHDDVRAALDRLAQEAKKRLKIITPTMTAKQRREAEKENLDVEKELVMEGFISQVAGWSFDEKPTHANLKEFFTARPDVMDRVDDVAGSLKLFFTESGGSS